MRAILTLYMVHETTDNFNPGLGWTSGEALALYGWYTMLVYVASIPGGYIGEKVGWNWGFGLAGIFMLLGMLQFYFAQNIFGDVGKKPVKAVVSDSKAEVKSEDKLNPFTTLDLIIIVIISVAGLIWILNDPYSKVSGNSLLDFSVGSIDGSNFTIMTALLLLIFLIVSRIMRYTTVVKDRMIAVVIFAFFTIFFWAAFEQAGGSMTIFAKDYTNRALVGNYALMFNIFNTLLTVIPLGIITWVLFKLFQQTFAKYALSNIFLGTSFVIIWGIVIWMLMNEYSKTETEVAASWFGILNSFFIIAFAPLFSKIWESKYNPSGAFKYAWGLILLGIGFGTLAYGANSIIPGETVIKVSMAWLILAYLFHTLGELCLSPVGLSYVSKLVPGRMIAFMFGVWYLAIAIGNKTAGSMGGMIDQITAEYSLTTFFLIFTLIPIGGGIILMVLNPVIKKLMHGVR